MKFVPIKTGIRVRRARRLNLLLQTEINEIGGKDKTEVIQLITKNISPLGAYFLTDAHLPFGKGVELRIRITSNTGGQETEGGRVVHCTGFVVRIDDLGMAVAFHEDAEISNIFCSNPLIMNYHDKQNLVQQRRDS